MVKCLAWNFASRGITVICLAHGGIKTDMWTEAAAKYLPNGENMSAAEIDREISKWSPFNRPGYPEDVAAWVTLLARPESQWMTGQTFNLSGGAQM
jgi:NAD(P)-dependent dehydrogenase (short-subunit alcohol dehydrogenase family)